MMSNLEKQHHSTFEELKQINGAGTLVPLVSLLDGTKVPTPDGYKKTKVGVIPEDWEVVKVGEVSEKNGQFGKR